MTVIFSSSRSGRLTTSPCTMLTPPFDEMPLRTPSWMAKLMNADGSEQPRNVAGSMPQWPISRASFAASTTMTRLL